jgi:hypothetical protein
MLTDAEWLKSITPLVTPFVNVIVTTFIQPVLNDLQKHRRVAKGLETQEVFDLFHSYLVRTYARYARISGVVFQHQPRELLEIYEPLTIRSPRAIQNLRPSGTDSVHKEQFSTTVSSYPRELFERHHHVLIIDGAGMGKSTLLRVVLLSAVRESAGIPVLVDLRRLDAKVTLQHYVQEILSSPDLKLDDDLLYALLKRGDFIFLLDGYDEVSVEHRVPVTEQIIDFLTRWPVNECIVTSRPETSLAAFDGCTHFGIDALTRAQALSLVGRYDRFGELHERLSADARLEDVGEFLGTPLLVALLYRSYQYKPTVPLKRHNFFRQVYDALYEAHDLSKPGGYVRDKRSNLDVDDFHSVMRVFAFVCMRREQIEFNRDQLVGMLNEAASLGSTTEFRRAALIEDLLVAVPLLVRDGDLLRWAHRSLQEYFAACFVVHDAKDDKPPLLERMCYGDKFHALEVTLRMIIEMDPMDFEDIIIYPIAKSVVSHVVDRPSPSEAFSPSALRRRREASFGRRTFARVERGGEPVLSIPYGYQRYYGFRLDVCSVEVCVSPVGRFLYSVAIPQISHPAVSESGPAFDLLREIERRHQKNKVVYEIDENPDAWFNSPTWFERITEAFRADTSVVSLDACRDLIKRVESRRASRTTSSLLEGL